MTTDRGSVRARVFRQVAEYTVRPVTSMAPGNRYGLWAARQVIAQATPALVPESRTAYRAAARFITANLDAASAVAV
ncbi:MAG: hypothetical protein JWN03_5994 [Nocardia sp.]|uniref:hypothetical protein n=1 Tax=Nocardia sp. TaxID=1821 RepID=UPI002601BD9A|nr:hypothetical protein [Nocardia sp.]MCU1645719.1 hypothetical protein [Nocardia sp.]